MGIKVAVVGATGAVGREMLQTLEERSFPSDEIIALASSKSIGKEVSYGEDRSLKVQGLDSYDFSGVDIALFSAGGAISGEFGPKVASKGAVVIDNSSKWRMEPDIPLIVPEVNGSDIAAYEKRNIIANPNCSTAQLVMTLKPLHDLYKIKRVVVSTYQSVSGAGNSGMDELFNQTRAVYVNDPVENKEFSKQIAFNCIPHIDIFMDDGFTKEEWKMVAETKKILDPNISLSATCVRVPVFVGHSESVNVEFSSDVDSKKIRKCLEKAPGCKVVDEIKDGGYITPVESSGDFITYISRIRDDQTQKNSINMWVVSDNLLKGAALNAVQIANVLIKKYIN